MTLIHDHVPVLSCEVFQFTLALQALNEHQCILFSLRNYFRGNPQR